MKNRPSGLKYKRWKIDYSAKSHPAWNRGLKGYGAGESHHWFGRDCSGIKNPTWKGDKVKYRGLHNWVVRCLGQPNQCKDCKIIAYGHQMHWANKSRKYKRELSDWLRLCAKCHGKYDKALRQGEYSH
jgi:hypothetical protein